MHDERETMILCEGRKFIQLLEGSKNKKSLTADGLIKTTEQDRMIMHNIILILF